MITYYKYLYLKSKKRTIWWTHYSCGVKGWNDKK